MSDDKDDDGAEAEQAARRVGGLSARFRAGETIYRPGDAARGWIVVESGRVRVGLTADTGPVRAEGVVLSVGKWVAFAEAKLLDATGRLCASATSTLLVFDKAP